MKFKPSSTCQTFKIFEIAILLFRSFLSYAECYTFFQLIHRTCSTCIIILLAIKQICSITVSVKISLKANTIPKAVLFLFYMPIMLSLHLPKNSVNQHQFWLFWKLNYQYSLVVYSLLMCYTLFLSLMPLPKDKVSLHLKLYCWLKRCSRHKWVIFSYF